MDKNQLLADLLKACLWYSLTIGRQKRRALRERMLFTVFELQAWRKVERRGL